MCISTDSYPIYKLATHVKYFFKSSCSIASPTQWASPLNTVDTYTTVLYTSYPVHKHKKRRELNSFWSTDHSLVRDETVLTLYGH